MNTLVFKASVVFLERRMRRVEEQVGKKGKGGEGERVEEEKGVGSRRKKRRRLK